MLTLLLLAGCAEQRSPIELGGHSYSDDGVANQTAPKVHRVRFDKSSSDRRLSRKPATMQMSGEGELYFQVPGLRLPPTPHQGERLVRLF